MELRERAERAVRDACDALGERLSADNEQLVAGIIERAMKDAIVEATSHSSDAAVACCGPDADMAHKIAREIDRKKTALIANLSSLR